MNAANHESFQPTVRPDFGTSAWKGEAVTVNLAAARVNAETIARAASLLGLSSKVSPHTDSFVVAFRSGDRCGDIECYDDGETIAVTYDQHGSPRTWDVDLDDAGLEQTLRHIQCYISVYG